MASTSVFLRGLPKVATEGDVLEAMLAFGEVTAVKRVRKLAFVDFVTPEAAEAAVSQGHLIEVRGSTCHIEKSTSGVGAGVDGRSGRVHTCEQCGRQFGSQKQLRAHQRTAGGHGAVVVDDGEWTSEDLNMFDMSASVMVADLSPALQSKVYAYMRQFAPGSPELEDVVKYIVENHPSSLRVKELFETTEIARAIGGFTHEYLSKSARADVPPVDTIYDLACGHALLGILLAYRFSRVRVVCVDLQARPCWAHYLAAWRAHGLPARGRAQPLENLEFSEGSIAEALAHVPPAATPLLVGVHACNDATTEMLAGAMALRAAWAAVPCCIPEKLYLPGAKFSRMPDQVRYSAMCGVLAAKHEAVRLTTISDTITNRNIVVMGDARAPVGPGGRAPPTVP